MSNFDGIYRETVGRSPRAGLRGLVRVMRGVGLVLTLHLMGRGTRITRAPLTIPFTGARTCPGFFVAVPLSSCLHERAVPCSAKP